MIYSCGLSGIDVITMMREHICHHRIFIYVLKWSKLTFCFLMCSYCITIQPDILNPLLLRLTSRKPLWLDLQPVDTKSWWRHNWKSAQVVNSQLVCHHTIRQSGFDLPRQQWSLLNRFHTEQGHCGVCRRNWRLTDTDLCPCGETQTMFHIVESCPDKTEWRLISATLRGWRRCFVADQLW